jgi:hypothetical protein
MLQSKGTYFSDIYWALSVGRHFDSKSAGEMKRYVMSSQNVRNAIKTLIDEKTSKLENSPAA